MSYITIEIVRSRVTFAQKQQLIHEVNDMMVRILDQEPDSAFVVIDEVDTEDLRATGVLSKRL